MTFIEEDGNKEIKPCVATIGCFDGVHCGHRFLISQVCSVADEMQLKSALITFPVHPRKVIQSDYCPQLLSCTEQKKSLISQLKADYCIMLPFTQEISQLSAFEFMHLLGYKYNVKALVIGYDHRFGHNRKERFEDYCSYGTSLNMKIIKAQPLASENNSVFISSSVIRNLLKNGCIGSANRYLGYRYFLDGTVTDGYKIGRTLGFPTANLRPSCPDKLVPATGVYAVKVTVEGNEYKGMLNIGNRPTVNNGSDISIEVHILDFHGDIYNKKMRIEFMERIRPEIKFGSTEELIRQLEKDKNIISKTDFK